MMQCPLSSWFVTTQKGVWGEGVALLTPLTGPRGKRHCEGKDSLDYILVSVIDCVRSLLRATEYDGLQKVKPSYN